MFIDLLLNLICRLVIYYLFFLIQVYNYVWTHLGHDHPWSKTTIPFSGGGETRVVIGGIASAYASLIVFKMNARKILL